MIRAGQVSLVLAIGASASATDILPLRNHRSSSLVFLRPLPLGPTLTSGSETTWQFALANELRDLPEVYEDLETWRISYLYRKSIEPGSEWFLEVPFLIRGGGILDPTLDWWHGIFVDDQNPLRAATPYGNTQVTVPGGTYGSASGIGDVSVGYGQKTSLGDTRLWIKIPTGNPNQLLGSGSPDIAVSLDSAWTINSKLRFSAHGGLTLQGQPKELDYARGLVESAALALAFKPNSKDTWLLQWNSEASPTRLDSPQINAAHRLITIAYVRKSGNSEWSFALMQDGDFGWFDFPGGAQIGPDLTIVIGYKFKK